METPCTQEVWAPEEYVPKLLKKLDTTGVDKVMEEMQQQVNAWKQAK